MKTRSRSILWPLGHSFSNGHRLYQNGATVDETYWDYDPPSAVGTQYTESEGHPFRKNNRPDGDIGGPFYTQRCDFSSDRKSLKQSFSKTYGPWPYDTRTYTGPVLPVSPTGISLPPFNASSNATLDAFGAMAVSLCKPTNSVANAATFLGETVKERLPSLPFLRSLQGDLRLLRNAGDEFLNVAFGWLPIVNDIREHAFAIKHAETVINQFERDAGKQVRRNYRFDTERSKDTTLYASNVSPWTAGTSTWMADVLGRGNVYRSVETERSRWFSGAFTYHLPTGYDSRSKMLRNALESEKLLGTNLTPETLWELTPWSWAIDWFTNAQDVLSNISDRVQFGLVMKYGYIMETSIVRHIYTYVPTTDIKPPFDVPLLIVTSVTKKRRQANPFGFGVTWEGLSPFQLAIAGALGLSKGA